MKSDEEKDGGLVILSDLGVSMIHGQNDAEAWGTFEWWSVKAIRSICRPGLCTLSHFLFISYFLSPLPFPFPNWNTWARSSECQRGVGEESLWEGERASAPKRVVPRAGFSQGGISICFLLSAHRGSFDVRTL